MEKCAKKIHINGIVQGVGFRPFIYQLAQRYHLAGYVSNTSHGVEIEVEGNTAEIAGFMHAISKEKPPLAQIVNLQHQQQPLQNYREFVIRASSAQENRTVLISPDMAVCGDCLVELFDPNDRRYRYPFINCTNCGPRYTIIHDIPYDRPYTAMARFAMCGQCSREYHDPGDRRFHAQPNACWQCGPQLWLVDRQGRPVTGTDPVRRAVDLLHQGHILAIKGLGGFHLAVDASNQQAVLRLRQRKHRQQKPFAIMAPDLQAIASYANLDGASRSLLQTPLAPIVLLPRRENSLIAPAVALEHDHYGVMLAYTPLHHLLIRANFPALVMTSGNFSEEPIVIANDQAIIRLEALADYLLLHDRDIYLRCDDSVQKFIAGQPALLRRGRGYAPAPILLDSKLPSILGCGAELKNSICLLRQDQAIVSQHIGDMENLETYQFFQQTIDHLQKIFQTRPQALAYDLHPGYLTTRYALEQKELAAIAIQHHYAHIVSVMAERHLHGEVIGIALDGTGYGSDGHIWGGEVLRASRQAWQRLAHLEYTPMPGADAAVRYPWRMALSYLYQAYGQDLFSQATNFLSPFSWRRGGAGVANAEAQSKHAINFKLWPFVRCGIFAAGD